MGDAAQRANFYIEAMPRALRGCLPDAKEVRHEHTLLAAK